MVYEQMLTMKDVAELLNVSIRSVRKWLHEGEISFHKLSGNQIRIKHTEFKRYLADREAKVLAQKAAKKALERGME